MQEFTSRMVGNSGYTYQIYTPQQLMMIAVRARLALETRKLLIQSNIQDASTQLTYLSNDLNTYYRMLKFIGEEVVELESIKLVNARLSRIEQLSVSIINTNGNFSNTSSEFCYFQSVQWLRISKQIDQLSQFHSFCVNFFRGRNITVDLTASSLLFQKYPILKYIKKSELFVLNEIFGLMQPYLKKNIQLAILQQLFRLNKEEINNKMKAPTSQGYFRKQGQHGYNAFQNQGNMQNTSNFQPSNQFFELNNNHSSNNQNSQRLIFFNRYARINNDTQYIQQKNTEESDYDTQQNNTLNLPIDPIFFSIVNFNLKPEDAFKKQRDLRSKKQKDQAERKATFLQQQSILQKRVEQFKIKQQNQRKIKQEQRKEKEQSQRDKQFQARRLAREKEEKQQQVEINVFADNQREGPQRETSGRFSNNFGMKVDFDQNEGQEFNYESPNQLSNSLLRSSQQPQQKQT